MSHIGNANKMVSDTPISDSTPHNVAELGMLCRTLERLASVRLDYINQLEANNDAANAEIERLTAKVAQLYEGAKEAKQRIHSLIAERDTARLQADQKVSLREEFRELLGTDDVQTGITVVCDLKQLASVRLGYIKQLEEENDAMRADLLLWHEQEVKP